MKNFFQSLIIGVMLIGLLVGCSAEKTYQDGKYQGRSEPDKRGSYGTINITVDGGKITDVDYKEYQNDGALKDENYQKGADKEVYELAQKAVKGTATYGKKLVEVQDVDKVDAVSGATNSNKQFKDAANKALENAKK